MVIILLTLVLSDSHEFGFSKIVVEQNLPSISKNSVDKYKDDLALNFDIIARDIKRGKITDIQDAVRQLARLNQESFNYNQSEIDPWRKFFYSWQSHANYLNEKGFRDMYDYQLWFTETANSLRSWRK